MSFLITLTCTGLRARPFPPVPWIVEIECSGRTLDADVDVLSMSLYDKDANEVLATLNLKTGDCTTTRRFSSCTRSQRGSHDSRISILFADIAGDATKSVGCDVTTLRSGERPSITSWFLSVTPPRMYSAV